MLNPQNKIYLSILLIALLISSAGWFIFRGSILPYRLDLAGEPVSTANYDKVLFHDLDRDGKSERLMIKNKPVKTDLRNIKIYDQKKGLLNQWNFQDSLLVNYLSFYDINRDGTEEIIVWIQTKDSLFLTILDIVKNKRILNHVFILSSPGPFPLKKWDIQNLLILFAEAPNQPIRYMYFALSSGYCFKPRGVYLFDLSQKRIVKKRALLASATDLQKIDVDNNGKYEILFSTYATDNDTTEQNYTDKKSWIILFNQNLDTLHTRQNAMPYSGFFTFPFYKKDTLFIASALNLGNKTQVSILDTSLNTVCSYLYPFKFRNLSIDQTKNIFTLYGAAASHQNITTLDSRLNLIRQTNIPNLTQGDFHQTVDFDRDGYSNYFSKSRHYFILLDEKLQKMAQVNFSREQGVFDISFNRQPHKTLPQISVNTSINHYLYNLVPNSVFVHFYLYYFFAIWLLLLILFSAHLLINRLRIYFSYFLFSLKDSDNAIVLLNHKGAIISFNQKVKKMLQLDSNLKNGQLYNVAFDKRDVVCTVIDEALKTKKQIKKGIAFEEAHAAFIGEISVTPFYSFFKFANAYLVEIKDSTQQVLADRHSNWQRTVRKMIHDIKNPLGGVQLKLQTIYLRLSEHYPEAAGELQDDLETANAEIKRIRSISKDFLKFSDLDKPQFKTINLRDFFKQILGHFTAFQNDYLKIGLCFAKNIPENIDIDKRQTELLLHILIENAIDAVKGKGKIEINLKLVQRLQINLGSELEIEIKDNGPGIPLEYQDKIFEPHFSTKKEGTGMGLVFAKHIVQQHSGRIAFKSNVGTCFIVTLPIPLTK